MNISIYNKTFDTLNGIIIFLSQILKYIAALDSFDELVNYNDPLYSNMFIVTAKDALEQQCISEVTKLTDNAHFQGYDNCSLLLLREYCLDKGMESYFPEGAGDYLIKDLDSCISALDSAISKKCIRNKQIAHHDFDQMMSGKEQSVSFSELISGIKETIKVICRISDRITNAEYNWACLDLDELKAKYKKEIVKLL